MTSGYIVDRTTSGAPPSPRMRSMTYDQPTSVITRLAHAAKAFGREGGPTCQGGFLAAGRPIPRKLYQWRIPVMLRRGARSRTASGRLMEVTTFRNSPTMRWTSRSSPTSRGSQGGEGGQAPGSNGKYQVGAR